MFYFFGCNLLKLIDLNDYKTYNLVKYHLLFWIFDDSSIFILLLSGLMYFLCIEGGRKVRAELISYNISWYYWNLPHQQVNWYKNTMISSRLKYRPYRDHFGSTRVNTKFWLVNIYRTGMNLYPKTPSIDYSSPSHATGLRFLHLFFFNTAHSSGEQWRLQEYFLEGSFKFVLKRLIRTSL